MSSQKMFNPYHASDAELRQPPFFDNPERHDLTDPINNLMNLSSPKIVFWSETRIKSHQYLMIGHLNVQLQMLLLLTLYF